VDICKSFEISLRFVYIPVTIDLEKGGNMGKHGFVPAVGAGKKKLQAFAAQDG